MKRPRLEVRNLSPSCNEVLILTALERGAGHGYQLAVELEEQSGGYFEFKHGTLYPILHKLEKDGLIEGTWSSEGQRGRRRHYRVTAKGRAYARAEREGWREFADRLFEVIGRTEK